MSAASVRTTGRRTVALVVPGLPHGGGVPTVGRFLHRVLSDSGRYDPSFVSLPMSSRDPGGVRLLHPPSWLRGPQVREGRWEGYPYREVGAIGTELEVLRMQPRRLLTELLDGFDLVQVVAGVPAWANVAARVRRPIVLQVATLTRVEREAKLRASHGVLGLWRAGMTRLSSRLDRTSLRNVRAAFVENAWMHDALSAWMPPGTVHFAPPGVDTERFHPLAEPPPRSYILAVGRFSDPRKNVRLLFRAYARLRALLPDPPPLVLAGSSGPTPADWAEADALGVRPHVAIREGLGNDDLAALYRGAALLALSSDEEGLGLVLLEAMASGVPVVSTACGGPQTCVVEGVTGFLTPVGDAAALAERMARLLSDDEARRAMGARARVHAEAHFSLEAAGRPFLRVYDALLDGRSSP